MPAIASRRRRLPRWTLRLRLTILYGSLFLVAGAVLLTITYELVAHSSAQTKANQVAFAAKGLDVAAVPQPLPGPVSGPDRGVAPNVVQIREYAGKVTKTIRRITAAQQRDLQKLAGRAQHALDQQRSAQLSALLTKSGIALGIMALVSIVLGWLVAGRALRPVRTMNARARGISERNLHERLALQGPDDELKELADTFDAVLGRLESAFESQRRFVANASHELRTPITLERTLVEVALADPHATVESLRATCLRVLAATERQEQMIEALLTLARSQRGLQSRSELDLAEIAAEALSSVRPCGVRVESELAAAPTFGDPALLERLVVNLLDNALRYNVEDGRVSVWTGMRAGRAVLSVSNSGPLVSAAEAHHLTEPFRRLNGERTEAPGVGLGLSIVAGIARAHGAELRLTPRPDGGLVAEVGFQATFGGLTAPAAPPDGVPLAVDVAGSR